MEMLAIVCVAILAGTCHAALNFENCPVKMEPLGCYLDKASDRAMPVEVLNAKNSASPNFGGKFVDWINYKPFLEDFMCTCAMKAYERGFKVIGLQFYGECWASLSGHTDYDKHGLSPYCYNGNYEKCLKSDTTCAGGDQTNKIYRIAPTLCELHFEPAGCYADSGATPRPFPSFTMQERDYRMPKYNGQLINWQKWNTYSPALICRCAREAKKVGHEYFAIQFYGECWTGASNSTSFYKNGPSDRCLADDYKDANINAYQAVGMDHANYIYKFRAPPASLG